MSIFALNLYACIWKNRDFAQETRKLTLFFNGAQWSVSIFRVRRSTCQSFGAPVQLKIINGFANWTAVINPLSIFPFSRPMCSRISTRTCLLRVGLHGRIEQHRLEIDVECILTRCPDLLCVACLPANLPDWFFSITRHVKLADFYVDTLQMERLPGSGARASFV